MCNNSIVMHTADLIVAYNFVVFESLKIKGGPKVHLGHHDHLTAYPMALYLLQVRHNSILHVHDRANFLSPLFSVPDSANARVSQCPGVWLDKGGLCGGHDPPQDQQ